MKIILKNKEHPETMKVFGGVQKVVKNGKIGTLTLQNGAQRLVNLSEWEIIK